MRLLLFISIPFLLISCAAPTSVTTESQLPYDFSKYNQRIVLPAELEEVSGIAIVDNNTLLCVQDEDGILFQYDIAQKSITRTFPFADKGDYEGIVLKGDTVYVLRSDGMLFEILDYSSDARIVTSHSTMIPAKNSEGLCYDKANNRLLIAPKGKTGKGKATKDIRTIYAYNINTRQLSAEPVYSFDMNELKEYALAHDLGVPVKRKKKSKSDMPVLHFRISSLEIHPVTGQLYMLSDVDNMILVYSAAGKLEYAEVLDEDDFTKAEGMSFFPNGDLLISNEANGKQPTLLRFNLR